LVSYRSGTPRDPRGGRRRRGGRATTTPAPVASKIFLKYEEIEERFKGHDLSKQAAEMAVELEKKVGK